MTFTQRVAVDFCGRKSAQDWQIAPGMLGRALDDPRLYRVLIGGMSCPREAATESMTAMSELCCLVSRRLELRRDHDPTCWTAARRSGKRHAVTLARRG
jgi:hypothetical protein